MWCYPGKKLTFKLFSFYIFVMKFFVSSAAISEYLLTFREPSIPCKISSFSVAHNVRRGSGTGDQSLIFRPAGNSNPGTLRNKVSSHPAPASPSKRRVL